MPSEPTLLDRDAELDVLGAMIEHAAAGTGSMVVIEGVAGIGKTRLLRAARAMAHDAGLTIRAARGSDLEQQFAFGIVRQLLEAPVRAAAAGSDALSGAAAGAAHLFGAAPGGSDPGELATLHGLYWLTASLFDGPAVFLIDDLHSADAASLRYLAYLQPRISELPLALLVTVRAGEQPVDSDLLTVLTSDSDVTVMPLRPLAETAAASLLAERLRTDVDIEFAGSCARATAGNPFLLHALAESIEREQLAPTRANAGRVESLGPQAVGRHVGQRLARLDPAAKAVAEAVAVLEASARLSTVAQFVETDPLSVSDRVEELAALGLVELDGDPVDQAVAFVHPLVRSAVHDSLSLRAQALAHAKAADVVERAGAEPERVAAHVLRVPPTVDPQAVVRLRRAAASATDSGSPEATLTFLDRCLQEDLPTVERLEVLRLAAEAAIQVDLDAAVRLLEQARAMAPDQVWVHAYLGNAYGFLRHPAQAVEAFTTAASLDSTDEDQRRRIEATLLVGAVLVPGAVSLTERIAQLSTLDGHDSVGGRMLDAAIGMHEMAAGDPAGADRARSALADGVLIQTVNGEGAVVSGWLALLAADDPLALTSIEAAIAQAHAHGSVRALAPAITFRAVGRLWTGQLTDAVADAERALRMARSGRVDMDPVFAGAYLADALTALGRFDEAEAVLRSIDVPSARPGPRPRYYALDAYARLLRLRGRAADAVATAIAAGQSWATYGFRTPAVGGWRSDAALSLYALGDPIGAQRWAAEELELARAWGGPRALGRALRVSGQLAGGADGLALLAESVAVLSGSPARLELATALVEHGAALRRSGRRTDARDALTQGLDLADLCDAAPLAEQARAELRLAGFRPRRDALTGPGSLTPSERRVAELAAAGGSNRDIAQALFVTVKTVEVHLTSAYRKLGVSRRRDLTTALRS